MEECLRKGVDLEEFGRFWPYAVVIEDGRELLSGWNHVRISGRSKENNVIKS